MIHEFKIKSIQMIKHLADTIPGIILGGISLSTIGTWVSILSGLFALFYTGLKIYDWFVEHRHSDKDQPTT